MIESTMRHAELTPEEEQRSGDRGELVPGADDGVQVVRAKAARVLDAWLADKAQGTRRVYTAGLRVFARFVGAKDDAGVVAGLIASTRGEANEVCSRYRAHLEDSGVSTATVRRLLTTVSSVTKEAKRLGFVDWEVQPKLPRLARVRDVRGPGMPHLANLQAALDRADDAFAARDRAVFSLLVDLGLRREEVATLDIHHLDGSCETLSVLRKGEDTRETVPVGPDTIASLTEWVNVRGSEPGPLFWRGSGRRLVPDARLTGQGIWWALRSRSFRAGLSQVRPHAIRHTVLSHLAEEGVALPHLLRFSGHRSVEAILPYLDSIADRRRELCSVLAKRRQRFDPDDEAIDH